MKQFLIVFICCSFLGFESFGQITDSTKNTSDTPVAPKGIMTQAQLDSISRTEVAIAYRKSHTDFYVLRKGRLFASWGLNKTNYGQSTIRFWGKGYDFKLLNATSSDQLSPITNFNARVGYYFTNKLSFSVNFDRMSYSLPYDQIVALEGFADSTARKTGVKNFENTRLLKLSDEGILYSLTMGVVSFELDYNSLFFETSNRKFAVDLVAGAGISAVMSEANLILFNQDRQFQNGFSGGGISGNLGLKLFFFKHFYLQPTVKFGGLFLPNITTNGNPIEQASQSISYFQRNITIGYQYKIAHK